MKREAILFDLDGTLLDTLEDLADSANAVLARRGHPTHPTEAYKFFIGGGVKRLVVKMLPESEGSEETIARCIGEVRAEYGQRWANKTRVYEGVPEMLRELTGREIPMAVYSNKPDDFARKCVDRFLPDFRFEVVIGAKQGNPRKPDPTVALGIARQMGVLPGKFLYLGDTSTDMQTAVAAGMFPVGVLWGFRTAEELRTNGAKELIERPGELPGLL